MLRNFLSISYTCLAIGLLTALHVNAQSPAGSIFKIFFENNFNTDQPGSYVGEEFESGWNNPIGATRQNTMDILNDEYSSRGNYMRGYFPINTHSPYLGGWSWNTRLAEPAEEIYFSYDIRFKQGFDWVQGGKIPGVTGGRVESGTKPGPDDGFSVRLMWKEAGRLVFYVYHHDQTIDFGNSYYWQDFAFHTGEWYNITFRIVMNSLSGSAGNNDGILEGFVNGRLVIQLNNFRFRNLPDIHIDNLYICSFFGGNDSTWNTTSNEWIDTDNYVAFAYNETLPYVPRGSQLSYWGTQLVHPLYNFGNTSWFGNLQVSSVTNESIAVSWVEHPDLNGYRIERSAAGGAFSQIAFVSPGVLRYSDFNISKGIQYTYRIISGNDTSNRVTAELPNVQPVPATPSGLYYTLDPTRKTILGWKDESDNETGFIIERIGPSENVKATFTVPANQTGFQDAGVIHNANYSYRIKSFNPAGESEFTLPLRVYTSFVDDQVWRSNILIGTVGTHSVGLAWMNYPVETFYRVERRLVNDGLYREISRLPYRRNIFTDKEAQPGITYVYRVRTNYGISNEVIVTTLSLDEQPGDTTHLPPPLPVDQRPAAPDSFKADTTYGDRIILTWRDLSQNEYGFVIEKISSSAATSGESILLSQNAESYSDTAISAGHHYQYILKAYNGYGIAVCSDTIRINLPAQMDTLINDPVVLTPMAPQSFSATINGLSQVYLEWTDVALNEYGYRLECISRPAGSTRLIMLARDISTYTDTMAIDTGVYRYSLAAYNGNGLSETIIAEVYKGESVLSGDTTFSAKASSALPTSFGNHTNTEGLFRIYPNPAKSWINLEFISPDETGGVTTFAIEVIDLFGRKYLQSFWESPSPKNQKILDLNGLTSGIYFIRIHSNGLIYTERLVIR